MSDIERIDELKLNVVGKIFFVAAAAWLLDRAVNVKVKGTRQEIDAVANVMMSSKRFQDELARPGATVESVMEKLNLKNASAREFERVLNVKWPL